MEVAFCLPLLFFFFLSALEFARVNMIRQTVENAVYEGSRRGVVPGATADELGSRHIVEDAEPTGAPTDEG